MQMGHSGFAGVRASEMASVTLNDKRKCAPPQLTNVVLRSTVQTIRRSRTGICLEAPCANPDGPAFGHRL
eukprot:6202078-Pleurochrysis_carterae.AAC.3